MKWFKKNIAKILLGPSFVLFNPCFGQKNKFELVKLIDSANQYSTAAKWSDAMVLWSKITMENPLRADFWLNFGDACYNGKSYKQAIPAYVKAFDLGSELPCFRAMNIAQCYAKLNDRKSCFQWLKRSIDLGYPYLDDLQHDSVLLSYYQLPEFKKLLWLQNKFTSRAEGWNYDLNFLDWQIKRVAFNPYKRFSKNDFAREIARIRNQILTGSTDLQITASLVKLLAMVGDGHTKLYAFFENKDLRRLVPLYLQFYKEGLFIVAADSSNSDLIKWKIDQIDDIPIDTLIRKLTPYINYDNSNWLKNASLVRLESPAFLHAIGMIHSAEYYSISVSNLHGELQKRRVYATERDSSTILEWTIPSDFVKIKAPEILSERKSDKKYWFEYLPASRAVYFKFNSTYDDPDESLTSFSNRLFRFIDSNAVSELIIDMRNNSGGNVFLVDSLIKMISCNKKINQKGSLFCLIGPLVFSAAQMFTVFLENNTNVIFVGEPTGSSPNFIGETGLFHLPYSHITGSISNLFWEYAGPYDNRTWIAPHILVYTSFSSRLQGIDDPLEAILSYHPQ